MKKLLLFISSLTLFLSFNFNVYALPNGLDIYPGQEESFIKLGTFYWVDGSLNLLGLDGQGSSSSPNLNSFYNGNTTLFIATRYLDPNSIRGNYAISYNLNETLFKDSSYNVKFILSGVDVPYYFNVISDVRNANINNQSRVCNGNVCTFNLNVTMLNNENELYINFQQVEGLNGYYFNELLIEVFFPQISSSSYFDTQGIEDKQNQTNENLEDIKESITDETPPDTDGLDGAAGWLPAGPVDSLINLPLSFFNSISRDLGSSCKPVSLPLPYVDKNLTLPCMSTFYDGIKINSFMDWVGLIASGFILFSYLLKLYKWVDDTLTFRENNHLDNWGGV